MNKEKIEKAFFGKRKTENLVVLLIIMIIVVVAINYIWKTPEKEENNIVEVEKTDKEAENNVQDDLEKKLEDILSNISGAGKVRVMITYSQSSITEPLYDENLKESNTTESDDNGGTRSISEVDNQKQIIYKQNADGSREPITKSVISPKMEGAIITSEGANDVNVKTNIIQAVEAATGLATHKIQVFEMEGNN